MMMNGKATLAVVMVSLAAIGLCAWDVAERSGSAQAATASPAEPDRGPRAALPEAVPTVSVALPADRVVAWRAPSRKAAPKAPCVARDEGVRALEQGSGTVRTYTFCK